jgi:hypothetical protein
MWLKKKLLLLSCHCWLPYTFDETNLDEKNRCIGCEMRLEIELASKPRCRQWWNNDAITMVLLVLPNFFFERLHIWFSRMIYLLNQIDWIFWGDF